MDQGEREVTKHRGKERSEWALRSKAYLFHWDKTPRRAGYRHTHRRRKNLRAVGTTMGSKGGLTRVTGGKRTLGQKMQKKSGETVTVRLESD